MSKRKWTKREEKVLLDRFQEYVDIGWNKGKKGLRTCPICKLFPRQGEQECWACPLADKDGNEECCAKAPSDRRDDIQQDSYGYGCSTFGRRRAKEHFRWLVKRFNAAGFEVGLIDEVIE